jgi:diguanylate cyclase (GGDEF)-like protein/PAS domain S-box-containing protein
MDLTDPADHARDPNPPRRVAVPISFTGDVAGFLFDLLSDIDAIVWEADAETFVMEFVNDRVADLLGYEPADMIAVPGFWSTRVVHPDDRKAFLASEAEVLAHGVARVTYRALAADGAVVWLSSVARLTTDQAGRRRVRGVETDVTAMKRAEEEARESEQRFRLLSEASRDSVIVHTGGVIAEVNQAFCEQFGWTCEEAVGLRPEDYIAPGSIAAAARRLAQDGPGEFEVEGIHRGGARRWYSAQSRGARFYGPHARVVVLTDITDMRRREQRALHDASHDQLTGLPNRAAFFRRAGQELEARMPGQILGLLYCDLNGFKAVNDTHGHAAGDALLQLAAQRLVSVVRTTDPVFRVGGDEFVILLPSLPAVAAERVIDLMKQRIVKVFAPSFSVGSAAARVGIAVGTAMSPPDAESADVLVDHADQAMYEHKRYLKQLAR